MKHDISTVWTGWSGPLGPMTLAATPNGLAGVWFDGQRHGPETSAWCRDPSHPVLLNAIAQLADYFAGRRLRFDLPLDLKAGTAFQQQVWQALLGIAPGATTSYSALGASIGKPAAVRAVGAAVGRNPVSIVVPCHRVVGADGSLTGYAGGLDRKTALLVLEGALI
jgi:methylated-DNA-[protein]-cysteine S-methyltransferase